MTKLSPGLRGATKRRALAGAAAALAAALTLSACAPADEPAAPEEEGSYSVSVGIGRAPTGALATAAQEEGLFADAGLTVDFTVFAEGGGPVIIQAMGGGNPDIGQVNLAAAVLAMSQGDIGIQIVGIPDNGMLANPLIATGDIDSVEDLRGKRVSTPNGGGQYYLLARILEAHDMTFDDIDFRPMPAGEAQAAFISGSLDAVISSANGTVLIQQTMPDAQIIATSAKPGNGADPVVNPDVFIATTEAIESNPEGIRAFIEAYHGIAVPWLYDAETSEEAIAAIQASMEKEGAAQKELDASIASMDSIEFYDLETATEILTSQELLDAIDAQVAFWLKAGVLTSEPDMSGAVNTKVLTGK